MEEGTADEVLYVERRGMGLLEFILLAGFLSLAVYAVVDGAIEGQLGSSLIFAGGTLAFTAWLGWYLWSPYGPSFKSVVVDSSGLTMGRLHLPADRIGDVRIVEATAAMGRSFSGKVGGRRVRWSSYGWLASEGPAVLVEDLEGGRRPWWLMATDDPVGVIEALDLLTRRRRRAWELDVPDPHGRLPKGAERSRRKGRRRYEQQDVPRG